MKSTERFKESVFTHLQDRATNDELFAVSFAKPEKNIDGCITYILNTVKASGCAGFEDEEIYSMAVHYYDEDNLKVGKPISANVVVNHTVDLSEEERKQAKEQAIKKLQDEVYASMKKPKHTAKRETSVEQPLLF